MATGPLEADPLSSLAAERDALARRLAEAETQVERLTAELAEAHAQLAGRDEGTSDRLSLFDGEPRPGELVGDGSDPRVLSLILGATAVVAGMVTLLALLNGKLGTPFGFIIVALTVGLAWAAARTRVQPIEIHVARGVVYAEQGETSYRFDLRRPETAVEMTGQPGQPGWSVRFPRRHLEPFVVDGSMVDAADFVEKLREYRPEL